jgi:hypothetical protein
MRMPHSGLIIGFPLATMHRGKSAVYASCACASAPVTSVKGLEILLHLL